MSNRSGATSRVAAGAPSADIVSGPSTAKHGGLQISVRTLWLIALFAASLLVWIAISWPSVQDDAFIHLRYAEQLRLHHLITYDGVHPNFGASSLLYVSLLALLRSLTLSPLLPRAISSVFHIVLFCGIAAAILRMPASARAARALALTYLAVISMPSSVRWLDDGMESSLVLCCAALLSFAVSRADRQLRLHLPHLLLLFLLGFVTVFLRVEMLLLLAAGSVAIYTARRALAPPEQQPSPSAGRLIFESAAPLLGGILAAALILVRMHALLPDTAIAKAGGIAASRSTAISTLVVFASSLSFGLGSLALWVLSLAAVWRTSTSPRITIAAVNCVFPVAVLLAVLRGQAVQGIRYFDWLLAFSLLWNLSELAHAPFGSVSRNANAVNRRLIQALGALAVLLIALLPIESVLFHRLFVAHKQSLADFRSQHLDRLQHLTLAAYDIGYIGYFTGSSVCDLAGLVNGRSFARLTPEQRLSACAASHPAMVYGNRGKLADFSRHLDLSRWSVCASYPVNNLVIPDEHYLVAAPQYAREVCAATGNPPRPVSNLLPSSAPALP